MLTEFECGNVACCRLTLANAPRVCSPFVGVETGIIILSSAQIQRRREARFCHHMPGRSSFFFALRRAKSVPAATRTACSLPGLRGLTRLARPAWIDLSRQRAAAVIVEAARASLKASDQRSTPKLPGIGSDESDPTPAFESGSPRPQVSYLASARRDSLL
jgi:hypothetical protein